ncbi:hypothetical protein VTI74DRAFT_6310 [Chaetomium olivicolor]
MPPPNTPEEGVSAPISPPESPRIFHLHQTSLRAPSPHPSSAMANPSRGESSIQPIDYQNVEYIGQVDDTLLCPICRTPFHSPITTPCGHTFCAGCINRALETQPTCPIDRQPINKTRDYLRLPLIIKEQLDRLKVKCPNKGCGYLCSREHLESHYERRCEFTPVRCPDPCCGKPIARRDAIPENGCMHLEVSCRYCDQLVTVAEMDTHYDHSCEGATAECSQCDEVVVRHRLEKHKSQDCPEGQTQCKWHTAGCKFADKRRIVQDHENSGCVFEAVGKLLEQRAEDRKIIDDLSNRLAAVEQRNRRHHRDRQRRADSFLTNGHPSVALNPGSGAAATTNPDLTLNNDNTPLFPGSPSAAADNSGSWGSPEDYMLAQFERLETQIEELRKKLAEVDTHQTVNQLQQNARVNEQLLDLGSKVGVLNMHTTWLMNMQRQNHAQQRAGGSGPGAGLSNSGGGMSDTGGGARGSGGGGGSSSSDGGGVRYQVGSRRNSDGRGENPPRL